jgi:hypothetical protein
MRITDFNIVDLRLLNSSNESTDTLISGESLRVEIRYNAPTRIYKPKFEVAVNCETLRIAQTNTISDKVTPDFIEGTGTLTLSWPKCFLTPNRYALDIFVADGDTGADLFVWSNALRFGIHAEKGSRIASGYPGFVKIPGNWLFSQ